MNPQSPPVIEPEIPVAKHTNGDRRPAEPDIAHREAFYRTTLRSIGDAVISTDKECRVTFINPVAEKLTGWTRDEALGRKLADVFVLASDSGEIILEDPASQVMREGLTVILPKGVKLKTRDGGQTPIDDSSAPILDDENHLLGTVVIRIGSVGGKTDCRGARWRPQYQKPDRPQRAWQLFHGLPPAGHAGTTFGQGAGPLPGPPLRDRRA